MDANHYHELNNYQLDRLEEFLFQRIENRQPEVEDLSDNTDLLPLEQEINVVKDEILNTIARY